MDTPYSHGFPEELTMPPMRISFLTAVFFLALSTGLSAQNTGGSMPDYKNPKLPVERRVADLLSRMTLEEKVAQTLCTWQNEKIIDKSGRLDPAGAEEVLRLGLGEVARINQEIGPKEGAERANAVQRIAVEKTRLGIPVIFHDEGLHGLMAKGGAFYPQAIGLAGTWDPSLAHAIFSAVADEARSRGITHLLSPVLDLARDPRWGRTEETYGEDPWLVSRFGVACITGLQGAGPGVDERHVLATMKHFAVHGQPQGGLNQNPGNISERIVRGEFLAPFRAAVSEARVLSVMPSYNEIDGVPSHASRWLLQKVLREEWGFDGLVISDYSGISQLHDTNFVARDRNAAAKKSLEAGVDVDLPNGDTFRTLVEQVRNGTVSETALDRAVSRVLKAKFLLGLFENPYADPEYAARINNSPEHRALALTAAHKTLTLLKNDRNLLPLDRTRIKRLAVIGPNAAGVHLGGYTWEPREGVSVLEGIRNKVGKNIEIRYAEGCRITENTPSWFQDEVKPADPVLNAKLIREAVKTAKSCDVILLCVGENESTCREAWARNHLGDRNTLDLPGEQNDLVKAMVETGVPVVVLLFNGRPLSINYIAEKVPAILEGWYLGQEGGTAAADVLFGDVNPGGKLPITFPRSVGHIPAYYSQKPTVGVDYLFETKDPLFPFGFGLSYTTFAYRNLRVAPEKIGPSGKATVTVEVVNTGKVAGDEVVQFYIRDLVGSVTRPVKELKGFERITLQPGEARTVSFGITPETLSFLDENMEWTVEPGEFSLMVGGNSRDVEAVKLEVVER